MNATEAGLRAALPPHVDRNLAHLENLARTAHIVVVDLIEREREANDTVTRLEAYTEQLKEPRPSALTIVYRQPPPSDPLVESARASAGLPPRPPEDPPVEDERTVRAAHEGFVRQHQMTLARATAERDDLRARYAAAAPRVQAAGQLLDACYRHLGLE